MVATAPDLPASYYESAGETVTVDPTLAVGAKVYGTKNGVYGYWEFGGWTKYGVALDTTTATNGTFTMPSHNVVVYGGWSDFTVETTAFTVTKTFKGIEAATEEEARALISGFVITLTPFIEDDLLDTFTLTLDDADTYPADVAISSAGDIVVTWTINDFPVGNGYTVSEDGQNIIGYKWLESDSAIPNGPVNSGDELAELLNVYEKLYTVTYVVDHNYTGDVEIGSESFPTSIATSDPIYEAGNTVDFKRELTYENIPGTLDGQIGYFVVSNWTAVPVDVVVPTSDENKTFTMPECDVVFTAEVTFVPTYAVTYEWDSTYATHISGITLLSVDDRHEVYDIVEFVNRLAYQEYFVVEIEGVRGVLTFDGWTNDQSVNLNGYEFTMPDSDVKFIGKWVFTPIYLVTYTWADGAKPSDTDLDGLLPDGGFNYAGTSITVEYLNGIAVKPATIAVQNALGSVIGYWTFLGWTTTDVDEFVNYQTESFDMPEKTVTLAGVWTYASSVSLIVRSYDDYYDTQAHTVTVLDTTYDKEKETIYYSLDGNTWYAETDPGFNNVWFTDVRRNAGGNVVSIPVYVKAVNNETGDERYPVAQEEGSPATVTIRPRPITIRANSARYRYTGAMRYVTDYAITSGSLATNASGVAETYTASAYGEGRGVSGGTRRYDVIMGRDANGNTVATRIYKTDGSDSTSNYAIILEDNVLEIWDTTNSYTPPTTTTTTTTPATTATVSLADPPAYQTIGDTTTPLAQMPEMVDIADETVPLGPVTGDVNPIAILICLLVISGAAIVIVGKKRFGKSN